MIVGQTYDEHGTRIVCLIEHGKLYAMSAEWKKEIPLSDITVYTDDPCVAYDLIITTPIKWPFMTNLKREIWEDMKSNEVVNGAGPHAKR